jgi:hypothetical protein
MESLVNRIHRESEEKRSSSGSRRSSGGSAGAAQAPRRAARPSQSPDASSRGSAGDHLRPLAGDLLSPSSSGAGSSPLSVSTELVPGADGPLSSATHHRLMFKSVRHRLERSHHAATEGGVNPLGEIVELESHDRSLADLLTGSLLKTPHVPTEPYLGEDDAPLLREDLASPTSATADGARLARARPGDGEPAPPPERRRKAPDGRPIVPDGPTKKTRRPTHFTWDEIPAPAAAPA